MERADDLNKEEELPLPGTEEPSDSDKSSDDPTEGPGNVSVDEPTEPSLDTAQKDGTAQG